MSAFEPVFLEQPLGERVSMTALKHFDACPRAGYLYAKHRASRFQNAAMVRGSAFHEVAERSIRAMLAADERTIPPELVKAIVAEVLSEMAVPLDEHDGLREMCHRWASEFQLFADEQVVGVETLFVLEVAGWDVRCKVDFASVRRDGDTIHVHIDDWKTSRGIPGWEDVGRKRPDGSVAAKTFQLVLYALAVVFGRPVETKTCPTCEGIPADENWLTCEDCGGRLTVDVPGEQVARGCQEVTAEFVYPAVEGYDGLMMRRSVSLTRLEMLEYLESLETIMKRLERAEQTGDWPAVASQKACDECPCVRECPIPGELNDYAGRINTPGEAVEALQRRDVVKRQDRALGRELRAFVKALPGSRMVVGDLVAEFQPRRSETVKDKDAFYAAIAGGMSVEDAREEFVRVSEGTTFVERELTEEERAA